MKYLVRVCLCLLVLLGIMQRVYAQEGRLYLAEMRSDGIVAPYLVNSGGAWRMLARKDFRDILRENVEWYVVGGEKVYQTVSEVIYDPNKMGSGPGFVTTYPTRKLHYSNIPSVGMAFSELIQLLSFERVDSTSFNTMDLKEAIRTKFAEEEVSLALRARNYAVNDTLYTYENMPVDPLLREKFEINVESMVVLSDEIEGKRLIFFSAKREYVGIIVCNTEARLQGWILADATLKGDYLLQPKSLSFGDCDGKTLESALDLEGVFNYGGKVYIVGKHQYYEGEGGELLEVKESEVISVIQW